MIAIAISNALLNAFFARGDSNPAIPTAGECYLGVSTTTPTLSAAGVITNFTEPGAATGYKRVRLGIKGNTATYTMDAAASGEIKNGSNKIYISTAVEGGGGFGTVTHFGLFSAQTGGAPVMAGALTTPVTVPEGNTLLIYENNLKVSME